MDKSSVMVYTLVLLSFIAVYFTPLGSAIMCYECNSVNDSRCMDPFDKSKNGDMLVNCSIEYPNATLCRKIYQSISAVTENPKRVLRRCAWEEHKNRDCYMDTSIDYKEEVCVCRQDGCNKAPQTTQSTQGLALAAAMVTSMFGLRHLMVVT